MSKIWKILLKPKAWLAKLLLAFFIIAFLSLGLLDYLQPIKIFLDSESLSFIVGDSRFSAYLITKTILTTFILFWLTGIFSEFGETYIKNVEKLKIGNKALVAKIFQILIYFLAFMLGLDILGIDLTAFAIFSGAIGIGIGFGLQRIASNFISGLILLFEKSVENNDLIELVDGTYGFVRYIGARYTLIETFQGKEIMIPNEDFIINRVTNWTYSNHNGRVEIVIGVSYDSDIEEVMGLILESAKEHPRCINNPQPVCYLREFADNSVNFLLLFWVADVTLGRYEPQSDVMRTIWKRFKEHNITIPYPQRDLHIKNPEIFK